MQSRPFIATAAAGLIFAGASTAIGGADELPMLSVQSGHSLVVHAPGLTRVAVGDSKIAGVVAIRNTDVIVNGKSAGQTTLLVWSGPRRTTYEVNVSEQGLEDVCSMIRSTLADPNLRVTTFQRSIVVGGSVQLPADKARIDDLLARFADDARANKYTVVNAVTVARPLGPLQDQMAAGSDGINVDRDAHGNLVVSGHVRDRAAAEAALDRVRSMGAAYLGAEGKVIDRLAVDSVSQVDVKVYVLEVDRTAMQQLGIQLQSAVPDVNHPGFYQLQGPSFPLLETPANIGKALTAGAFYRTTVIAPTINLLVQNGHAKILSSPDLVTMPGKKATFLVGGQIPIPFASGIGQISIEYKEFGVRLQVTPTILGNGGIETTIAPEVSSLDFQDAVQISGFTIPALKTSRLTTDVITQNGESIIMGGLMQRTEQRNIQKIPLLGDIPIIGKLFRSTSYQNGETDVVFVMTPQVITR